MRSSKIPQDETETMTRPDESQTGPAFQPGAPATGPVPEAGASALSSSLETSAPAAEREAADATWQPVFGPGVLVAGRYRVVRFLAQGGMAQVYEAQDLELGEPVALKTLRPDIAQNEQAVEFFKREIQLARKVTHEGVCRIFDLGRHRLHGPGTVGAPGEDVLFLTMELLQGESLRQRLQRMGRMRPAEALGILAQMAAALRAAHDAGVVHRDLKSQNVMLCRRNGFLRVVVTDFGLACPSSLLRGRDPSLAGTERMIGTPAYMAPEQVEGKELRPATDVYAFGVVAYEMLTGQLPFSGASALDTALARLRQDPPSPRKLVPELPARWERTLLRCLERDPRDRFASPVEAVQRLQGEELNRMDRPRPRPQARSRVPLVLAGLVAAGVLGLSRLDLRPWLPAAGEALDAAPTPAPLVVPRRAVALLGFRNLSGRAEAAWIGPALTEMLRTELGSAALLRIVPSESVAGMKSRLGLAEPDSYAEATLRRIGAETGAEYVVLGSYLAYEAPEGAALRLDVLLQQTRSGETLASIAETGSEAQLAALASSLGVRLRERLAGAAR